MSEGGEAGAVLNKPTARGQRLPPKKMAEAPRLEQLPSIAFVVVDENTSADIDFEGHRMSAINIRGRNADWPNIEGGIIHPGRSFTHVEDAANSHVAVVNTKLAENLFGQRDPMARRLNSSHSQISYAVFCLKKKKTHTMTHTHADEQSQTYAE